MKRTIDMMTAARAKGVELPGEWFGWVCPVCNEQVDRAADRCVSGNRASNYQRVDNVTPEYRYIGPDLTLPENLHHAFRFADALDHGSVDVTKAGDGFVCWLYPDINTEYSGTAPERHLALVAACEAAMGIQHDGKDKS